MATFNNGSKWKGFYDAPFPYGRQEFTLDVEEVTPDNAFLAIGHDKEGKFSAKGSLSNITLASEEGNETCDINFVKDYVSKDGYKGVEYKGKLNGSKIIGHYSFVWRKSFINKSITGIFEMTLVSS